MATTQDLNEAIEASHRALDQITRGDPSGFFELYSDAEDATLANPYGPPARGRAEIEDAGRRAAAAYRDGKAVGFESFAKHEGGELAYILEIERFETKLDGSHELSPIALRVTSIFRREAGSWKLLHRHADPITTPRPPQSVLQR
jgi:ketosteroid isomerase-like protein